MDLFKLMIIQRVEPVHEEWSYVSAVLRRIFFRAFEDKDDIQVSNTFYEVLCEQLKLS